MKIHFLFFSFFLSVVLLFSSGCLPEPAATENPCDITNTIRNKYNNDAVRLAVRMQQSGSGADQVLISESLIDRAMNALSAVYNSNSPARDSVVSIYDIHTLPYPEYDEFRVEVDTTETWVKEWVKEKTLTGNATIDNLMTTYGLTVEAFLPLSVNFAVITSIDPINIAALVDDFEAVPGVIGVQYNSVTSGGNDITIQDLGTTVKLTYKVGYDNAATINNCTGECDKVHSWVFDTQVTTDACNAEFIESFGDPAP